METVTSESDGESGVSAGPVTAHAPATPGARARLRRSALRYQFAFIVGFAVGLVASGQLVEDLIDSPPLQMVPPSISIPRSAVVAVVLYILVIVRVVHLTVRRSLPTLHRILRIDAESFRTYEARMDPTNIRVHLTLLGASAVIVALLYPVLGSDLPLPDPVTHGPVHLPVEPLGAAAVLVAYTLVGWAVLTLVNVTIRLGRALSALSRERFEIDVFDTTNMLPFGNIALAVALAPAGVILILLPGLGPPSSPLGWSVLVLAASAGVFALLLPLRGIHHQMSVAKQEALANLNERINLAYNEATAPSIAVAQLGPLNERTNTLLPLRRTVQEMTTWPFRDTVAFGRAILIASAPLIYAALEQIWISPLGGP